MEPNNCKVGMRIEYAPSPGHWFTGTVAAEPWLLGDTWVTKLVDMESGYAVFAGKRGDKATNVYVAALCRIRKDWRPECDRWSE